MSETTGSLTPTTVIAGSDPVVAELASPFGIPTGVQVTQPAGPGELNAGSSTLETNNVKDETHPASEFFEKLLKESRKRKGLDASIPLINQAATTWLTNQDVIRAVHAHSDKTAYPLVPVFGICTNVFNYHGRYSAANSATSQEVDALVRYDPDWRWKWIASEQVTRHSLKLFPPLNEAIQKLDSEGVAPIGQFTRIRGRIFEGTVFVDLARQMLPTNTVRGYSAMMPMAKCLAYLTSLMLPADHGGLQTASMACDSPIALDTNFFPYAPNPANALGRIQALFITTRAYTLIKLGQIVMPAGWEPDKIGTKIVVVPVPVTWVGAPKAILWLTACYLRYPMRAWHRTGQASDWHGGLTGVAVASVRAPFRPDWYPSTILLDIEGPGRAAADSIKVLYVITGDYGNAPGRFTLALTAAVTLPLHDNPRTIAVEAVIEPAAAAIPDDWVDVAPAISGIFDDLASAPDSLVQVQQLLMQYMGAALDLADAITMVQTQASLYSQVGESRCGLPLEYGTLGPRYTSTRGWAYADQVDHWTDANRVTPLALFTNAVCSYPSVAFSATGAVSADGTLISAELPIFDMELSLMMATGVAYMDEAAPEGTQALALHEVAATVMSGSYAIAMATDMLLTRKGVARNLLWVHSAGITAAQVRCLRSRIADTWGRPGTLAPSGAVTVPLLLSKKLFASRATVRAPANGVLFDAAALARIWQNRGHHMLARIPQIEYTRRKCGPTHPLSQLVDLRGMNWSPIIGADLQSYDRQATLPNVTLSNEWEKAWHLASQLEGFGLNAGFTFNGLWNTIRANPAAREALTFSFPPQFAWGSLLSVGTAAVARGRIDMQPSTFILPMGRPLQAFNNMMVQRFVLVATIPSYALTEFYASWRPHYAESVTDDEWAHVFTSDKEVSDALRFGGI